MPLLKVDDRIDRQLSTSAEASCCVRRDYALDLTADVLVQDLLLQLLVLCVVVDQVQVQVRVLAQQRQLALDFRSVLAPEGWSVEVREILGKDSAPRRRTGRTGRAG